MRITTKQLCKIMQQRYKYNMKVAVSRMAVLSHTDKTNRKVTQFVSEERKKFYHTMKLVKEISQAWSDNRVKTLQVVVM